MCITSFHVYSQSGLACTLHHGRAMGEKIMNSNERHEARYQRRKAERERRKVERARAVGGLSRVFTYNAMYKAGKKCCCGVRWKNSTQRFELHLFSETAKRRRELFEHKWTPGKYVSFILRERGKERPIDAPRIQDRQVHKTLTRGALLPLYLPDMIYNNGASLPGKGFHFACRQLKEELHEHYRRYGREGSVILMDFKKFFPSASHAAVFARHERLLRHPNIREIADKIVRSMPGDYGLPLGVEVSQMEMVGLPSALDNFIKCQLGLKGAGHYMDDYYILVPPERDAGAVLELVIVKAQESGLTVNLAKTRIQSLKKPFKYCKAKYTLTETGRVYMNGNRASMKRARHKIRAFKRMVDAGKMALEDLRTGAQGSIAYFENYDDHNRVLRLRRLFYAIFGFSVENNQNFKEGGGDQCSMWFTDDFERDA